MAFGPELNETPAQLLPGQDPEKIPAILLGLVANIRCLESAYDLVRIGRLRGDKTVRAIQVRKTLDGLKQMRDAFEAKLEQHPLYDQHFVRVRPLPEAGVARLRALGLN